MFIAIYVIFSVREQQSIVCELKQQGFVLQKGIVSNYVVCDFQNSENVFKCLELDTCIL